MKKSPLYIFNLNSRCEVRKTLTLMSFCTKPFRIRSLANFNFENHSRDHKDLETKIEKKSDPLYLFGLNSQLIFVTVAIVEVPSA